MESLEVVQKGLSLCPTYQVSSEGNDIILTVQKYLFTSKWTMVKGKQGAEVAFMKVNFLKSKFEISFGADPIGTLQFPPLKPNFRLSIGGKQFRGEGRFGFFKYPIERNLAASV